jgi:hypothetical protein
VFVVPNAYAKEGIYKGNYDTEGLAKLLGLSKDDLIKNVNEDDGLTWLRDQVAELNSPLEDEKQYVKLTNRALFYAQPRELDNFYVVRDDDDKPVSVWVSEAAFLAMSAQNFGGSGW